MSDYKSIQYDQMHDEFSRDELYIKVTTVVIITEGFSEGNHTASQVIKNDLLYHSDFWESQPNGQHDVYIKRGGISNRYMPNAEKKQFVKFILPYCNDVQKLACLCRVQNEDGNILQVRIEEKI